jgi:hypothetical protein
MDVDVKNGDVFTEWDGDMWQYRDDLNRFIGTEEVDEWTSTPRLSWEKDITHSEAIARIRAMGHTVSGDVAPSEVDLIAEAVRVGGIVDCTSGKPVVRKVIGAMPVTKDGVVVSVDSDVYAADGERLTVYAAEESLLNHFKDGPPDDCEYVGFYSYYEHDTGYSELSIYDIRECYSTPEAAKADAGVSNG